jgi:hypothetical protein
MNWQLVFMLTPNLPKKNFSFTGVQSDGFAA